MNWSVIRTWFGELRSRWGEQSVDWLLAAAVLIVLFVVLRIIVAVVKRRATSWAERTKTTWGDALPKMLGATHNWFLLLVSAYFALLVPDLRPDYQAGARSVAIIALLVQAALWGVVLLEYRLERYINRQMETDPAAATTVSMLSFVGKLVLWTVVLLLALENAGVDVTALVAGLGVGGIAIALASQNILGDLFSALSIVLDKPFVLGDFVIVGDLMGTVEKIGLKTTRLRSLSGEQLVFSNADLLQSRIRNFKQMYERRVVFSIGVTYQTSAEQLEEIPGLIRGIVESQADVRFDRSHFKEYGDSALVFETVYFVRSPDYNRYMDIHQAVNFALYRLFASKSIEFAYPTQTVHLERAES